MARLLFLLALVGVAYCQSGIPDCGNVDETNFRELNAAERFCVNQSLAVRRQEHFYCRGYVDDEGAVVPGTEAAPDPETDDDIWTIFLQYPALAYMDIARKQRLFFILAQLISFDPLVCSVNYTDFCVDNVELYGVTDYEESVLISLYNFDLTVDQGETIGDRVERCFRNGFAKEGQIDNGDLVTRFLGQRAFNIIINRTLGQMFSENIHPGSTIRDPDDDPTLHAVFLGSWAGRVSVDYAADRANFVSNPNPINYGLEAGDIVFAFFGSVLLVIVAALVILGFFIHPFFFS